MPKLVWKLSSQEVDYWHVYTDYLNDSPVNSSFVSPMKTPGSTTSSSIDSTSVSYLELVNFKKGTKCHATAIDILKDDKYYGIFHRGFIATARAQGPSNVCDPDYKPKKEDPYKQQLFEEQQSFVFS